MPKISIIILNWNGWEDTIECLESLFRVNYDNYEVFLVDNFSSNDSLIQIRSWINWNIQVKSKYYEKTYCSHKIRLYEYSRDDIDNWTYLESKKIINLSSDSKKLFLFKNNSNDWFAGWNNLAIRQILQESDSEYLFLLNNDTVIDPNLFSELINEIYSINDTKIGIVWPKIFSYHQDTHQIKYFSEISHFKKVHWVSWAAFIVSKDVLNAVWLFDEHLFLYWEDTDLCLRIWDYFNNYYIQTDSKVHHKIGWSSKGVSRMKIVFHVRNLFILLRRHKSYKFKQLLISILQIINNNIRISLFFTISYVSLGILKWVMAYFRNHKPKY